MNTVGYKTFLPGFIQLFILALFVRSNVYFGSTAVSLLNVLNIVAIGYILLSFHRGFSREFSVVLVLFLTYYVVEVAYLICYYRDIEQVKEFYYSSFLLTLFLLFYWGIKQEIHTFIRKVFNVLFYVYLLIFAIVVYELFTQSHLPGSRALVDKSMVIYPTAFFYNPNDFAVVIALLLPMIYYLALLVNSKIRFWIIACLSLFYIIVTMSRGSLIILFLFPFLGLFINYKARFSHKLSLFLYAASIFVVILFLQRYSLSGDGSLFSSNAGKLSTIFHAQTVSGTEEESGFNNNIRYRVYAAILDRPEDFIFGKGFMAGEQLYINKVIPLQNPHSFWAEGIFDFGFLGFLPILLLFAFLVIVSFMGLTINIFFRYSLIQLFFFILLVNIPSGIMSLPLCWLPIAFITALFFNYPQLQTMRLNK
jgi:hypothetical protein